MGKKISEIVYFQFDLRFVMTENCKVRLISGQVSLVVAKSHSNITITKAKLARKIFNFHNRN